MSIRTVSILGVVTSAMIIAIGVLIWRDEPIHGGVFLDGAPLSQADLFLVGNEPSNSASRCFARTDSAGCFEIKTPLLPGEYRVVVKKLIGDSLDSVLLLTKGESEVDSMQEEARTLALADTARLQGTRSRSGTAGSQMKQLPEIFSSPEHTVLRLQVPSSGSAAVDLHLSMNAHQRLASGQESFIKTR